MRVSSVWGRELPWHSAKAPAALLTIASASSEQMSLF